MATDKGKRDSIFESTAGGENAKAPGGENLEPTSTGLQSRKTTGTRVAVKRPGSKKEPKAEAPAPKAAAKKVEKPETGGGDGGGSSGDGGGDARFSPDRSNTMLAILQTHANEILYRKTKEDRLFILGLSLVAAIAASAFLIRGLSGCGSGGWFFCLVYKGFFALVTLAVGFTSAAMVELNRTRLQDLLAMTVKIHDSLDLFEDGAYAKDGGAFLPNTYKFVGSINDDETNYVVLVLKLGAVAAAAAVLFLA
ncbi:hypothetical protein K8I61_09035 [bacterium]|nr:hypothetical protein [bacterium]